MQNLPFNPKNWVDEQSQKEADILNRDNISTVPFDCEDGANVLQDKLANNGYNNILTPEQILAVKQYFVQLL